MSSKKIIFLADVFVSEVLGGGELNNKEAVILLREEGYEVSEKKCATVTPQYLAENGDSFFIIANFIELNNHCKYLIQKLNYIIYEHDHKYVKSRNPADYPDFIAPPGEIINCDLYASAKSVLVQSIQHKKIIESNLKLSSVINLGGNLWALSDLEKMRNISELPKESKHAIMASHIWHKNTTGAITYCIERGLDYELIEDIGYHPFLEALGKYSDFVFLPKTPETLSRVTVEARMMGLKVHTSNLVGAMSEDWIKLKGSELIDTMIEKRKDIIDRIKKIIQ